MQLHRMEFRLVHTCILDFFLRQLQAPEISKVTALVELTTLSQTAILTPTATSPCSSTVITPILSAITQNAVRLLLLPRGLLTRLHYPRTDTCHHSTTSCLRCTWVDVAGMRYPCSKISVVCPEGQSDTDMVKLC